MQLEGVFTSTMTQYGFHNFNSGFRGGIMSLTCKMLFTKTAVSVVKPFSSNKV
jgi:hypothetical protein